MSASSSSSIRTASSEEPVEPAAASVDISVVARFEKAIDGPVVLIFFFLMLPYFLVSALWRCAGIIEPVGNPRFVL